MFYQLLSVLPLFLSLAASHGSHGSPDTASGGDWALFHMQEEHHISNFDPASFFTMHDFNSDGLWSADEIRRTYGLDDESLKDTPADVKEHVVTEVLRMFDASDSKAVSRDQFLQHSRAGKKLPDFGLGSGHHGDMEYEYEIHHFEKFHSGDDVKEEDLTHPEDIEHFRKHEELEMEHYRVEQEQKQQIVENNIPLKFRRQN